MKIKRGFVMRKIADYDVVVPIGKNIIDFNGIITLNKSAAFLWKHLIEGVDPEQLAEVLSKEYEIDHDLALKDSEYFVSQLEQKNLLEKYE